MKVQYSEITVIGSGIAGLFYALHCASFARVLIITKGPIGESNTMYAQGGIAAVINENDSLSNHELDTLRAGDGLCNVDAVRTMVAEAKECIQELEDLHVHFNKTPAGQYDFHREGGHSHARVLHHTDATGREVERSLVDAVRKHPNITILENHFAMDLLVQDSTVIGVSVLSDSDNVPLQVISKIMMLATGGAGQVFLRNTNPAVATGDGLAMAYRAGAVLQDMEFVQFHPTTLYSPGKDTFLITEAIRGWGAELKRKDGSSFMERYHSLRSLAPRDVVSRAIYNEMVQSGETCVYLDLRGFNQTELESQFPNIYARCLEEGINPAQSMIPVMPAAHYMCGGIQTDLQGKTSLKNLYACGECSCTGVHGANRLASNSLLEGLVFARRAANDSRRTYSLAAFSDRSTPRGFTMNKKPNGRIRAMKKQIQSMMWRFAGIVRDAKGLARGRDILNRLYTETKNLIRTEGVSKPGMELLNLIQTAMLITEAAVNRKESRGCHYRSDYPEKADVPKHSYQIRNIPANHEAVN